MDSVESDLEIKFEKEITELKIVKKGTACSASLGMPYGVSKAAMTSSLK